MQEVPETGLIPGSGRSPAGGHSHPLQYSCLKSTNDRGAWRAVVHGVAKNLTQLKRLSTHAHISRKSAHSLTPDKAKFRVCGVLYILEWILEGVTYLFSSESSQSRDWTGSPALQVDSLPTEPHEGVKILCISPCVCMRIKQTPGCGFFSYWLTKQNGVQFISLL